MATLTAGAFGTDIDQLDINSLLLGFASGQSSTGFTLNTNGQVDTFVGSGFQFGGNGFPTAGVITQITETFSGQMVFDLSGLSVTTPTLLAWAANAGNEVARSTMLSGGDLITGSGLADRLRGYAGNDTINAGAGNDFVEGGDGNDQVFAGAGDDVIVDAFGTNYLRGEDGNDVIQGGTGFDDINGNMGNDTLSGGDGGDWVVGGKDNDVLFGEAGGDIVYGNLGDDTCSGGDGDDVVRGGQGNDSVSGGVGNDYVSGDRGDDTVSGGLGADLFHGSQDAGIDRVLDFSLAQGDRVMLDPGTTYTFGQVGADTVINMGGANQMILVGVQSSTLTGAWIFLG